jgi:hypothetical protein
MAKKTKYFIFDVSNELESLIAVFERSEEATISLKARINLAREIHEKNSDLASLSFYDDIELYEDGAWFEDWLNQRGCKDIWDDTSIIVSDDDPREDSSHVRVSTVLFHASQDGFWWRIFPKHSDITLETRFLPLGDDLAKELLEV